MLLLVLFFANVKNRPCFKGGFNYLQSARHFMRQAVVVSVRAKNKNSNPERIAPITLAMATSTNKSISDKSIVPKTPANNTESVGQRQFSLSSHLNTRVDARATARKPVATPKNTQRRGVPIARFPVKVKNAVTTPIITLTITAILVQLNLHWQLFIIKITSHSNLC